MFTWEEGTYTTYKVILCNAKEVSAQMNSQFRVVEKMHQDVTLSFDWLQSINYKVDWVNYGVTLENGFAAAGVPVHHNVKDELYSFKVPMHLLHANKLSSSWFIFFYQVSGH